MKSVVVVAGQLVEGARTFTEGLYKGEENYNKNNEVPVFFEGLVFLTHLLDRKLFAKYGAKKRSEKLELVLVSFKKDFLDKSVYESFKRLLNTRQEEYANYLWENKDKSMKNTALWEFSKIISELLTGNGKDYLAIMSSYSGMVITIKYFLPQEKDL